MKAKKIILFILIITIFATTFCLADDIQASSLIHSSGASAQVNSSGIKIIFDVYGKSTMTDIGASTIYIKSSSGITVKTYSYTSYSSMMGHNRNTYSSSITYTGGISGHQYYAVVYCRATNSSGSDTKINTTNTVTAP